MIYMNTNTEPIAYRDDAGKHFVDPGEPFEIVGAQHVPAVLAIPGVEIVSADDALEMVAVPGESLPEVPASAYAPDAVTLEPAPDDEEAEPARKGRR